MIDSFLLTVSSLLSMAIRNMKTVTESFPDSDKPNISATGTPATGNRSARHSPETTGAKLPDTWSI